jgi:hypothetical protein
VLKTKNISKQICCACIILVLFCSVLIACAYKPAPQVIAINTTETLYIDDIVANLPEINIKYDDNTQKTAAANDFWFNGKHTYVQDNKMFVKPTAPYIFEDEMQIIYRNNENIKTTLRIIKQYVPLESLSLTAENGKTRCSAGSSIQMAPIFTPSNATDRNVTYEITNDYEYAAIGPNGLLSVNKNAASGDEITIVVMNGDIVSPIFTVTVAMPTVTQTVVVFDGTEQVTDKNDTYTDFFAFDEIDLYELKRQGYEDILFSFKVEAREITSGYADIYLDLEKKNGGVWCVYRSEGFFVIGAVGWTDYADDGYGANTWGYFADNTRETNISITKLIQNCGAVPLIRLSCGANGSGQNKWIHGYSTITISVS